MARCRFLASCIHDLVTNDLQWIERNKFISCWWAMGPRWQLAPAFLGTDPARRYVRLTGLVAQSEAPKLLACADVLVSPHVSNADRSEFFGSPTKLFEYMAMKKPVWPRPSAGSPMSFPGAGPPSWGRCLPASTALRPAVRAGKAEAFKQGLPPGRRPGIAGLRWRWLRAEILSRYTWKQHVGANMKQNGGIDLRPRV